jgi:hypothetical protein
MRKAISGLRPDAVERLAEIVTLEIAKHELRGNLIVDRLSEISIRFQCIKFRTPLDASRDSAQEHRAQIVKMSTFSHLGRDLCVRSALLRPFPPRLVNPNVLVPPVKSI